MSKKIGVFGGAEDVASIAGALASRAKGVELVPVSIPERKTYEPPTIRTQPAPDGDDESERVTGAQVPLPSTSFLPEEERQLQDSSFGKGNQDPTHPTNDA